LSVLVWDSPYPFYSRLFIRRKGLLRRAKVQYWMQRMYLWLG